MVVFAYSFIFHRTSPLLPTTLPKKLASLFDHCFHCRFVFELSTFPNQAFFLHIHNGKLIYCLFILTLTWKNFNLYYGRWSLFSSSLGASQLQVLRVGTATCLDRRCGKNRKSYLITSQCWQDPQPKATVTASCHGDLVSLCDDMIICQS